MILFVIVPKLLGKNVALSAKIIREIKKRFI